MYRVLGDEAKDIDSREHFEKEKNVLTSQEISGSEIWFT